MRKWNNAKAVRKCWGVHTEGVETNYLYFKLGELTLQHYRRYFTSGLSGILRTTVLLKQ